MNKRAVFDDWADVMVTIVVVAVVLLVFGFFTKSEQINIQNAVTDYSNQLSRESFLVTYLKTPVAQTDFAKVTGNAPKNIKLLADQAINDKLIMMDLYSRVLANNDYISLITEISKYDTTSPKTNIILVTPDGRNWYITQSCTLGKTSVATIPTVNGSTVQIRLMKC